ncbi:MAG TPA: thioredoxin domain-containing protein [Solirubrobacterales bacterium]|jgi:protein-disulfide isomerase|nr:thioredoxin domain-containing protein [Solirubrobacterales bacterium]
MATRREERERLRNLREEAQERDRARQRRLTRLAAAACLLVLCAVAVAILASGGGGGDGGKVQGGEDVAERLAGLEQHGTLLGRPGAPTTVVEFGDLQCPVCREYSTSLVAELIDGPVRSGRARIEFRNWSILGGESRLAGAAAYAAAEQNRFWNFVELFYRNQQTENSGYVTPAFLREIAQGAGVPDLARWERDRRVVRWRARMSRTEAEARAHGFSGTPSFAVEGPRGTLALGTPSSAAEVEAALAEAE